MLYSSLQQLRNCLAATEFSSFTEDAVKALVRTVRLVTVPTDGDVSPVGNSKLGGFPDVPPGFVWPECTPIPKTFGYLPHQNIGGPLWFIGQINTDELPQTAFRFPNCLLSFFAAVQRDGFPGTGGNFDDWKVFCFPTSGLSRFTPPQFSEALTNILHEYESELLHRGRPCFKPSLLRFDEIYALPHFWPEGFDSRSKKLGQVLRSSSELWSPQPLHLFLGYPQRMNAASSRSIGSAGRMVQALEVSNKMSVKQQVEDDKRDDHEWLLLAQFDTDKALDLYWAGWDQAYFIIRRSDLVRGHFEKAVFLNDHT